MGIAKTLTKVKAKRVCGIDASTNSLAFAVFEGDKPIQCGEIYFKGATPFERLKDARRKVSVLVKAGVFKEVDYIVIESAIMVRNIQTAIDLAYVYGAIMSELSEVCKQLHKVAPISWQSGIGNPNLKKAEKDAIMAEFPGKSKSWYQNKGRLLRKQRTLDIARQYFTIPTNSDNVGDAIGIALFAAQTLTRAS
jgi:Holliday junction resolvasome RuvABC endonuclease subunit